MLKIEMVKRIKELEGMLRAKNDEIRLLEDAMVREETHTIFRELNDTIHDLSFFSRMLTY